MMHIIQTAKNVTWDYDYKSMYLDLLYIHRNMIHIKLYIHTIISFQKLLLSSMYI